MISNKHVDKIDAMRVQRGWSFNKLATMSRVDAATIYRWITYESLPTLENLQKVCRALGVSLADFFAIENMVEATPEFKELYNNWLSVTQNEKESIRAIMKSYLDKNQN